MKQKLSVRAIINQNGKALLLKRANGRQSILGKFELPGGKLNYGEQPDDALRRYLQDDVGLQVKTAQLFDAVTYIDYDDRNIQYGVITYIVTVADSDNSIELSGNYSKYKWHPLSSSQHIDLTDLTQLLLGIMQQEALTDEAILANARNVEERTTNGAVTIFSDGGSRGNPGPSAAGYVIVDSEQHPIAEGGEFLGITTNNQAEYHGVRLGLEKAKELGVRKINFKVDSMLIVNQMNGQYRIKNRELWPIHERVRELVASFDRVSFSHVPREFNQLADGMVNKTLDEHKSMHKNSV